MKLDREDHTKIIIPDGVWRLINKEFDGHYTLMKFTTNYRFCFGILDPMDYHRWRIQIEKMAEDESASIAMIKEFNLYSHLGCDEYHKHYKISDDELLGRTGLRVNCTVSQQSDNVWEMGNKNTLTDKEIEVLKIAVHWFMEAVAYCDEFNVQKIKGFPDEYWKMDDALYGAEMLLDKLTD